MGGPGTCLWRLTGYGSEVYCGAPCASGYVYCGLHTGQVERTDETDADRDLEQLDAIRSEMVEPWEPRITDA